MMIEDERYFLKNFEVAYDNLSIIPHLWTKKCGIFM